MTVRALRRTAIVYFAAYAVFVTFPGVVPFRGPRPFVFGLPFALVWVTLWIVGGFVVLVALDRAYRRLDAGDEGGRQLRATNAGDSGGVR